MALEEAHMAYDNMKTPRPVPDAEEAPGARRLADEVTGSRTGTIGGGGREAHNSSAVRATGSDDDMVGYERSESDEEFDTEEFDDEDLDDEESEAEEAERE